DNGAAYQLERVDALLVDVQREQRAEALAHVHACPLGGDVCGGADVGREVEPLPVLPAPLDRAHHPRRQRRVERLGQHLAAPLQVGVGLHRRHAATVHPQRIEPGPGQESVWDYPRPPALEKTSSRLRVVFAGATIAETTDAYRVLETSQPPAYYFPPDDVAMEFLVATHHRTFCEWKGQAHYYTVVANA